MGRVYKIKNPATNALNDIPLEDNAVLLSGYVSDIGSIFQGKLFARVYDSDMLQVLNLDTPNGQYGFVRESFPVDGQIYVSPSAEDTYTDEEIINEKFYSSYYDVPLVINGADISSDFGTGDDVWLVVSFGLDYKTWTPTGIVGTSMIQANVNSGSGLIRLGCCKGDFGIVGDQNQNKFALEDNKPIYYYDGVTMTELRIWLAQHAGGGLTPFYASIASNARIGFLSSQQTAAITSAGLQISEGTYQITGNVVFANAVKTPLRAHVVLYWKQLPNSYGMVAAADVTIPVAYANGSNTNDGMVAVSLCGHFVVRSAQEILFEMRVEVEAPDSVSPSVEYAYIPQYCPVSGTYALGAISQGARAFLQKVAN